MAVKKQKKYIPLWNKVLIRHDDDEEKSEGGILLPKGSTASKENHYLTGRVIRLPREGTAEGIGEDLPYKPYQDQDQRIPFEELDRVIYDIRRRIPVDATENCKFFFVEKTDILSIVEEEEVEVPDEAPKPEEPKKDDEGPEQVEVEV